MKILIINAGSSSLKYQLIDMSNEQMLAKGNCEKIGLSSGIFGHKTADGRSKKISDIPMKNHTEAFNLVKEALLDEEVGVLKSLNEVSAIGHRIVQGGSIFNKSVLVNEHVKKDIASLIPLAPLHNDAHLQGIEACEAVFGKKIPQVVVFDTAFHSTMPPEAYMFAVPYKYYKENKIRRYGFHGTSHRYVSARCAELMNKDLKDIKIISCHLGNGSSITAIKDAKVQDTSMGLTPLDGIMMGSRSGTLDPSVVTFIAEIEKGITPSEMSNLLNKQSGMLGISGISSDDREVSAAAEEGDPRAQLAHNMLRYHILKYIGQYIAVLGGCDAIVFTAGIGENQPDHRSKVCKRLAYFGVKIDEDKNAKMIRGKEGEISTPDSKIKVYVIPTNEELVIARDTKLIVESKNI